MMFVQNWGEVFTQSLQGIWYGVIGLVPTLIFAVAIFVVGWILASLVDKLIMGIFKALKVDAMIKATGVEDVIERSGYKLNSGAFVGGLVKWFIIIVFLVAALDVIGLSQVNSFLKEVVLSYLPDVIVAVLMLMVAAILGDAVQKIVVASAKAAHIHTASFLGKVAKWAIWIVAILTALVRLGLDAGPLNTIFMGIVAALALALGLAFGLGCKEQAGSLVEKIAKDISARD